MVAIRLDIRRKFIPMRVVRHRNKLLRGAVEVASLELLKARVDEALSILVCRGYPHLWQEVGIRGSLRLLSTQPIL